ncbi:hypothetical protein PAHAL_3G424500 [Panicum hallii]|uniref:Uncharacterized protein n=1 Tax=Panicum hallii TaxID=206008 RepID=A0A2T8KL65_9POAL|nr:hypothetical protein PAHAL_3G424500 [Panicum hallii]PVH62892.1 hypothetical protein PAHAL_3G424500 [Panicum hallii]PVH62893.1 hypothetical protein PAHAL_3G424500 [Panicum hallii]
MLFATASRARRPGAPTSAPPFLDLPLPLLLRPRGLQAPPACWPRRTARPMLTHAAGGGAHGSACGAWARRGSGREGRAAPAARATSALLSHPSLTLDPVLQPQKSKGTKPGCSPPARAPTLSAATSRSAAASRRGGGGYGCRRLCCRPGPAPARPAPVAATAVCGRVQKGDHRNVSHQLAATLVTFLSRATAYAHHPSAPTPLRRDSARKQTEADKQHGNATTDRLENSRSSTPGS